MCLRIRLTRQPGVCCLQPRDAEAQSIRRACGRKHDMLFLITVLWINPCLENFVNKDNQLHSVHPMGWLFRNFRHLHLGNTHTHTLILTRAGNKIHTEGLLNDRSKGRAGLALRLLADSIQLDQIPPHGVGGEWPTMRWKIQLGAFVANRSKGSSVLKMNTNNDMFFLGMNFKKSEYN